MLFRLAANALHNHQLKRAVVQAQVDSILSGIDAKIAASFEAAEALGRPYPQTPEEMDAVLADYAAQQAAPNTEEST